MKRALLVLLAIAIVFTAVSCDDSTSSSEVTSVLPIEITSFTEDNYGTFTDAYYRTRGKDTRTITNGKWDLSPASSGGAYYMGTAQSITFSDAQGTNETYDVVVKAGEKYQMTIVVSNYTGLYMGGNAFSSKNTVTPDAGGLITATDSSGTTTFVVTMEVKEGGVDYAIKVGEEEATTKSITYSLQDEEEVRVGFTWWATTGYVESIKIEKL